MPGQRHGTVQTDGDRRPSQSTSDGSRYPRFVPSGSRLGLWQHRLRGVQGGRRPPCSGCVVVSPAARGARLAPAPWSMLDARSFMISHSLRSQVGFAAAVAHARLRLSRLELIGGSGRTAGRYASAARVFISYSPTAFEQARGGALSSGRRPGRVHWGRPLLSRPRGAFSSGAAAVESAADTGRIRSSRGRADQRMCSSWVWIVVRFVCVIRVPVCARVSRVCPGPGFPATTAPPS